MDINDFYYLNDIFIIDRFTFTFSILAFIASNSTHIVKKEHFNSSSLLNISLLKYLSLVRIKEFFFEIS
ncbi:MAG: hypothetical protein KAT05_15715 [Spirochaetes bacterium]|nr:hypothetical protein [Spirochaetota bacterium]